MLSQQNELSQAVHVSGLCNWVMCPQIRYWRQHEREAAADRVRTAGLEATARVAGLRPSTRYHVAVLAYNSAGTGPPSPRTTVTTRKPRTENSLMFESFQLAKTWDTSVSRNASCNSCLFVSAPNRPPGNVSWKAQGSLVTVRWDPVTAMHNESTVLGYKVSGIFFG